MGDIQLDTQVAPSTPGAGSSILYVDSSSALLSSKNANGLVQPVPLWIQNQAVAAQGPGFAADTYVVGSNITVPGGFPRVGTRYHLTIDVSKTAAGTATPILIVRFGIAGSVADTAALTFTWSAGTAAADLGVIEVDALFRTVGAGTAAVLQGRAEFRHGISASTGLISQVSQLLQVTSSGFDSTVAASIIGASLNGGASAAWTTGLVVSELIGF
jgi:hypothetical protein